MICQSWAFLAPKLDFYEILQISQSSSFGLGQTLNQSLIPITVFDSSGHCGQHKHRKMSNFSCLAATFWQALLVRKTGFAASTPRSRGLVLSKFVFPKPDPEVPEVIHEPKVLAKAELCFDFAKVFAGAEFERTLISLIECQLSLTYFVKRGPPLGVWRNSQLSLFIDKTFATKHPSVSFCKERTCWLVRGSFKSLVWKERKK